MVRFSKQTAIRKIRRYIIGPAFLLIGLIVFGYAGQHSRFLYSEGDVGLAVQVIGLGLMFGSISVISAISEWASQSNTPPVETGKDGETYTMSVFVVVVWIFLVILIFCGLALMIGGHYI